MNTSRSALTAPLQVLADESAREVTDREVSALRAELRGARERIDFRKRRGWMFMALLLLTSATTFAFAFELLASPGSVFGPQTPFAETATLFVLFTVATPLAGYFALHYNRQRERMRATRARRREILRRLAQLDGLPGHGLRRRRRHRSRRWMWDIAEPPSFTRPHLESLGTQQLDEAAVRLGTSLTEGRNTHTVAYLHAGLTGGVTLGIVFALTLSGPESLASFVSEVPWGGTAGPDPLLYWLMLTVVSVLVGGAGSHRVSVLLRRARGHQDRLASIERSLSDALVLARERREQVVLHPRQLGPPADDTRMVGPGTPAGQDPAPDCSVRLALGGGVTRSAVPGIGIARDRAEANSPITPARATTPATLASFERGPGTISARDDAWASRSSEPT